MNKLRLTINALAIVIFTLTVSSLAQAQATRTWVSGVGDDVNPCSRTAPCKTFAGAISKTADKGEIDALDPGGFGTVTITKSITIDGTQGAGFGSILAAGTTGVNVNDSASGAPNTHIVRLRNLSINGAGTGVHGINGTAFKTLYVENCAIAGFQNSSASRGIRIALSVSNSTVFVKDTDISNNASGMEVGTTAGNVVLFSLDKVRLEGMTDGFIMGIGSNGSIRDSAIVGMSGVGVKLLASGGNVGIERTVISLCGTGIQPIAGNTTVLSNVTMIGDTTAIAATGGTVQSHGNNQFSLNSSNGVAPTPIGQQ